MYLQTINKIKINGQEYKIGKEYDIQTVNIQPNDIILIRLNNYLDLDEIQMIVRHLETFFPHNKIIPIQNNFIKNMTIIRQSQSIVDSTINEPLKNLYPDLFKKDEII